MTSLPTTQQRRARHAWETARAAATSPNVDWDEFDGEVKRLGPRIVAAGLGPAVAFAEAKKGAEVAKALSAWILNKGDGKLPKAELLERIRNGNSDELRRWTAEALEWIVWVKRFCDAETKQREAKRNTHTKAHGDE